MLTYLMAKLIYTFSSRNMGEDLIICYSSVGVWEAPTCWQIAFSNMLLLQGKHWFLFWKIQALLKY